MKGWTVLALILVILLFIGIAVFYQPPEKGEYKTFQKGVITFKYPANWKQYSTKVMEGAVVAVGDPATVGYENMSVPTTMLIISKTSQPINSSNPYPANYLSQQMMEGDVNTMQSLQSYATTPGDSYMDSLIQSMINPLLMNWDARIITSTLINSFNGIFYPSNVMKSSLGPYFSDYTGYHQMNYTIHNASVADLNAQEFTMTGLNTYTNHTEYSRVISFEKRNETEMTFYVIMCSTMSPDIEEASKQFDTIIRSLRIS